MLNWFFLLIRKENTVIDIKESHLKDLSVIAKSLHGLTISITPMFLLHEKDLMNVLTVLVELTKKMEQKLKAPLLLAIHDIDHDPHIGENIATDKKKQMVEWFKAYADKHRAVEGAEED
jgi:hypothetical protein